MIQVTPLLAAELGDNPLISEGRVHTTPTPGADVIACFPQEIRRQRFWPSNNPGSGKTVLGPLSANYDYYASWIAPHIVVVDRETAYALAEEFPLPGIEKIFDDLVYVPKPTTPGKKKPRKGE